MAVTLVHTKEGLGKIKDVKIGDKVLSYNEQTGQNEYQTVLQTFERYATDVLSIKISGEAEQIGVTSEHPFFVRTQGARSNLKGDEDGEWKAAGELKVGDEIRTASGEWVSVEAIESRTTERVYNFEVSRNHNYFVGEIGLLNHNVCTRVQRWKQLADQPNTRLQRIEIQIGESIDDRYRNDPLARKRNGYSYFCGHRAWQTFL